jgi:glycosyltransferase involved in cell wall biosynthesis
MSKKILHIITSLDDGGAEGVLFRLVSFKESKYRHFVVSLTGGEKYTNLLKENNVPVKLLNINGFISLIISIPKLWLYMIKLKPNLIQTWMYHSDVIGGIIAFLSGYRVILWNVRSAEIHKKYKITTRVIIKISALLSKNIPIKIIAPSNRTIKIHKNIGYANKFHLINNGVDRAIFYYSKDRRDAFRKKFDIDESCILLGMVARFDAQKDHYNLLKAVSCINNYDFKLILVGSNIDSNNDLLLGWLNELNISDKVILAGQIPDIYNVMCGIDYLVLPSLYGEAFPNVLIEAMASGRPCIATDIGDSGRIISNTGWVIEPNSYLALANTIQLALKLIIHDKKNYNILSRRSINAVHHHFSLDKMVVEYEKVWDSLI